ncbi:MAG: hypothetical protein IKH58_01585 [Bacteroidales bacterium]|nr:hypothetical protein [Bacteroidales bacterium]
MAKIGYAPIAAYPFLAKIGYSPIAAYPFLAKIGYAPTGASILSAVRVLYPTAA